MKVCKNAKKAAGLIGITFCRNLDLATTRTFFFITTFEQFLIFLDGFASASPPSLHVFFITEREAPQLKNTSALFPVG